MAWMRTSVSLFTFGFSIIKFIDYLGQRQAANQFSEGIYRLGFALVCLGILGLMIAVVEHVHRIRRAKELGLPTISRFSLPIAATVTLLLIGVATLLLSF
jgi:putative membrane protein